MSGYFDHNATTPMSTAARLAWSEAAERSWHNPSSLYREAGEAKRILEDWRAALADHFDLDEPERIVFTSGATEANNAVVAYLARTLSGSVAVSELEHPSVAASVDSFFGNGRTRRLATRRETGAVETGAVVEVLSRGEADAVALMAANNESGALQPWPEVAALCREAGLPFLCDATQWIGKLPAAGLAEAGFVTGSAHKFGGGKGAGFLILPEGADADFHGLVGGPQEQGLRAGTENLPAVAAMVTALLERDEESLGAIALAQGAFRDAFEDRLVAELGIKVLGRGGERLWNTASFVLPHTKNLKWLVRLSQRGFAVSTGSACSAGRGNPSAVMAAMGLDFEEMGRVLRVSGGPDSAQDDWADLAAALFEVDAELRG